MISMVTHRPFRAGVRFGSRPCRSSPSQAEKTQLRAKREGTVQDADRLQERIRRAAALGDLSENSGIPLREGKKTARSQLHLAELEAKLKSVSGFHNEHVPERRGVSRPHVKLLDRSDDKRTALVPPSSAKPVTPDVNAMFLPVSVNSRWAKR